MRFPSKVVVATHNPGKLAEWRSLLTAMGVEAQSAADRSLPEPEETESTYRGNARLKARAAADLTGLPAIADDTGFEAAALGNAPGVLTAPWAAQHGGYPRALHEMIRRAGAGTQARLVCAVALATAEVVVVDEAFVAGTIRAAPSDAPGFAAILDAGAPLLRGGVLAHRRAAFEQLTSR
ncbi:MAG: non-canonical purine NTP pyrophosphatase [Nannocystaceae bacterium]|nr:non-canonical purine NTP pyrophosphatase [bacterium]